MKASIEFEPDDKRKLIDPLYDYSNEGASEAYINLTGVEKFFMYSCSSNKSFDLKDLEGEMLKLYKNGSECVNKAAEEYGKIYDPDSKSELVRNVYKALWDKEFLDYCKKEDNTDEITGETLNSVRTTLNEYYEFKRPCELKELNQTYNTKRRMSIIYILSRYFENSSQPRDNIPFLWGGEFETMVSLYHTIGNFMPVPCGCNAPRGEIRSSVRDYWDLTLWHICKYYEKKDVENIKSILSRYKNISTRYTDEEYSKLVQRYQDWLDKFVNWENFVNNNYLRAFVDDQLKPIELWKGHFDNYTKENKDDNKSKPSPLPQNGAQCEEFFAKASLCIIKRTIDMLDALEAGGYLD